MNWARTAIGEAPKALIPDAPGRGNPRFVVTSLPKGRYETRALYEPLSVYQYISVANGPLYIIAIRQQNTQVLGAVLLIA